SATYFAQCRAGPRSADPRADVAVLKLLVWLARGRAAFAVRQGCRAAVLTGSCSPVARIEKGVVPRLSSARRSGNHGTHQEIIGLGGKAGYDFSPGKVGECRARFERGVYREHY